jgi:hypothetical protein
MDFLLGRHWRPAPGVHTDVDHPNSGARGRCSSQPKTATVLRLLRGEDLELVSRELGLTAATLSG